MIVLKFGGTSLATAERILGAADIIDAQREAKPVVVVSALAGVTNQLLAATDQASRHGLAEALDMVEGIRDRHREVAAALVPEGSPQDLKLRKSMDSLCDLARDNLKRIAEKGTASNRDRAAVLATGEDLASALLVRTLEARGGSAAGVDARTVIRTDGRSGDARPIPERISEAVALHILPRLEASVVVVQGFIGADDAGTTTTLGRGGSDTTATLLGAALAAREIQIWTDVDGILSGDPRVVTSARVVPEIGFEEAIELAYFGARVLHPAAMKHATAAGVPLRVLNTLNPGAPGTLVRPDRRVEAGVAAIAYRKGTALVTVRSLPMFMAHGFLARVFEVVARRELAVDLVATSHTSTSFTVWDDAPLDDVLEELRPICETRVEHGFATFSVIGQGLFEEVGILARVFGALDEIGVRLVTQASEVSLNFLVEEALAERCARTLHEVLIEGRTGEGDAGGSPLPASDSA